MKSSQSNFDLRSPSSYLARSYLIATVTPVLKKLSNAVVYHLLLCLSYFLLRQSLEILSWMETVCGALRSRLVDKKRPAEL